jgi:hypothetical protein
MPNFNFVVPLSPTFSGNELGLGAAIRPESAPEVYTTAGPLPLANGVITTTRSLKFYPNSVTEGTFDCGRFGSQA